MAPGRSARALTVIHEAGVDGITLTELLRVIDDVRAYDLKQIVSSLRKRGKVTVSVWRQLPGRERAEEVFVCACPMNHKPAHPEGPQVVPYRAPDRLTDDERDLGRAAIAATRDLLDSVPDRKI